MKPSERAEELIEHLFRVHGHEPILGDRLEVKQKQEDGSERALGGWCKVAVRQVLLPALEAAEREAFEAGVTLGRLWEDGSLDSEYDIATKPTYDNWRRD